MLKSMTGFGTATVTTNTFAATVDIKSVNGRFLKTQVRVPSGRAAQERELEMLVKSTINRGSVSLTVRFETMGSEALVTVNEDVVAAYQEVFAKLGLPETNIPSLPGVIGHDTDRNLDSEQWASVVQAAQQAVANLVQMRQNEGEQLQEILRKLLDELGSTNKAVSQRVPDVVSTYQDRLKGRIEALLHKSGIQPEPEVLAREVAIFADRCDITEEIDRMDAHIEQGRSLLETDQDAGKSLDFLTQEMHREANTMASKSADAQLSQMVMSMKTLIERLKEQVANVE